MTDEFDYSTLLDRAVNAMPKDLKSGADRWVLPDPDLMVEGRTTVWKNFEDICVSVRRDPEHLMGYVLRGLGSAGSRDGRRVIFKSLISTDKLKEKLQEYIETFVLCGECGKPDTHLVKEARTQVVECMACGAKRPVTVKKGITAKDRKLALNVGDEFEVLIQDVGRMGDGLAKIDRFVIYVPGVAKGTTVKIKIEKVTGTIAVGRKQIT